MTGRYCRQHGYSHDRNPQIKVRMIAINLWPPRLEMMMFSVCGYDDHADMLEQFFQIKREQHPEQKPTGTAWTWLRCGNRKVRLITACLHLDRYDAWRIANAMRWVTRRQQDEPDAEDASRTRVYRQP